LQYRAPRAAVPDADQTAQPDIVSGPERRT
jgi:hypothetical protein